MSESSEGNNLMDDIFHAYNNNKKTELTINVPVTFWVLFFIHLKSKEIRKWLFNQHCIWITITRMGALMSGSKSWSKYGKLTLSYTYCHALSLKNDQIMQTWNLWTIMNPGLQRHYYISRTACGEKQERKLKTTNALELMETEIGTFRGEVSFNTYKCLLELKLNYKKCNCFIWSNQR